MAIVKENKRNRISHYDVKYVPIDDKLETRLRNIVIRKIDQSNSLEEYTYDCPEPEEDQIKAIQSEDTDFIKIKDVLDNITPEEDIIADVDELIKAKAYIIILRDAEGINIVGFKKLPENWKMKKAKALFLCFIKKIDLST